jgi:hypothetical protein
MGSIETILLPRDSKLLNLIPNRLRRKSMEIRDLTQASELTPAERSRVGGGFEYDPNYVSSDVIDARGGQFQFLGLTFTVDVNGNISSVS